MELLLPAAALSGCAGLATGNTEMPLRSPDLTYREVASARLKSVLKNYDTYDTFEISDPRWVHSIKAGIGLPAFASAIRTACAAMPYSSTGTRPRFAVQTDNCDLQTYYPLGQMPTGLNPLH